MTAARDLRRVVLDLVAVALLLSVGIIGFAPTFDSPRYLVTAYGALALGLAIAWVGARLRWGVLPVTGASVAAVFVFGGVLALPHTALFGVVPTLETWRLLAVGAVTSWKSLLTTVPPVSVGDGHLLVPLLLTLVAAVLTASFALRLRRAAWSLLPAAAFVAAQILLGVARAAAPLLQGILFAAVAVIWLALRAAWASDQAAAVRVEAAQQPDLPASRATRTRRLIAGAAVLTVAAGAGVATAAVADPPVSRYVLRDFVIPPFDIRQYPSPLQSFRGTVRDAADTELFTVTGLPEDGRVRLATMDAYNGVVYNVADDGAGSSSAFTPVRSNMSPGATGTRTTVRIEIGKLEGVWLPDVGAVRELRFDGDRAGELRRSAHYNDATGTAVVTAGLAAGDAYTLETLVADIPSDAALADAPFAPLKMPKQVGVPESLIEQAATATADAETPIERVRALENWLHTDGYFSHGLAGEAYSPSGHGAARIMALLSGEQMIGDDEQYAVAMALMANQLGMPARVVMGWYPGEQDGGEGVFTATGDNLHAWVEVAFAGHGWVAFDPTPDEDNEPSDQSTQPQANPKPQVLQPPPPAQEPADLPPSIANDREQNDEEEPGENWLGPVLVYGAIGLGTVLVLLAPFLVMGAVKAARRARRRRAERAADRISGGWDELVDRAVDLRAPVVVGATRAESAEIVTAAFDEPRAAVLAARADAEVFGPADPTPEDVEAFWREVDDIVGGMSGSASVWQRLRARLSLRSLRRGR